LIELKQEEDQAAAWCSPLGAQAVEVRLRGGLGRFRHFRRAAEMPFNLILEVRHGVEG